MRQSDMRQHLLTTGLRVLHARGFNGCGVQEITDAAKVPKGSFYNHFDSKERFGAEVLGRYWEDRASRALAVLSDEALPPLERLKAYFTAKTGGGPSVPVEGAVAPDTEAKSRTRSARSGPVPIASSPAGSATIAPVATGSVSTAPAPPESAPSGSTTTGSGRFTRGCMIGNFAAELAGQSRMVRDRLGAVFAAWTSLLAGCIREAQQDGSLAADIAPETLAAFLIDAFEGAVLRTKVDQDPAALLRFRQIVFTRLLV